ncbi:MCE family protein [Williamsia maris]|uniref:Phospholipid/cholesterol/gamma-HCH transport system substrate-binding protein n=1 Tax=Williamsia maris TaxID=72806 RepID=A0ABT1HG50_9NOCA|nr:MCE family protein [Williamsia maris]MCP2176711.1 phospholipid/cholesterol/gamma-HCH transport system substrate-binding protein [Williamsia maris]
MARSTARSRAFRNTSIKLGSFAVVMVLIFVALVVVFSQYRSGSSNDYKATFANASQLKSGSKVRIAGVEVGKVGGVSLTASNTATVDFSVDRQYRLPKSVHAMIRYENLTGDRFVEIAEGTGEPGAFLSDGGTIPESQTEPALDLDKLLGGFKPLFKTLNPAEVNELSSSLIQVFQGQGPALTQLLRSTASFTNTIADRDQLIGEVIDNLNGTLKTIDADKAGFDTSLDRLQQLISGLASQKDSIGAAVTNTSQLTNDLAGLLDTTRPDLKNIVTRTGQVSDQVLGDEPFLRGLLQRFPGDFKALSNLGSYGAWLQIWLCRVDIYFTGPDHKEIVYRSLDDTGNNVNPGGRCATPK